MARYTEARCRLCRREGLKLFLKGDRCYTEKCAFERANYAPGQHGATRSKISDYALRLREKQKVRRIYGILESQFRKYFAMADRQKGMTGVNLLQLLERRLDNVVYRLGFADSRSQARQFVRHGHFKVNGKRVDIPSYSVKTRDIIELIQTDPVNEIIKQALEGVQRRGVPDWLALDAQAYKGTVTSLPERHHVVTPIQEQFIVEFYSK